MCSDDWKAIGLWTLDLLLATLCGVVVILVIAWLT